MNGAALIATSSTYTLAGDLATSTDANGNTSTNSYDADDRISSVTSPIGVVTSFVYDSMSRKTQVINPMIQSTPLLQTAYTPDGARASLTDANNNTTNYTYDGFNRLSIANYPGGGSTETYTYDADSNVLSRTTRKGDTLSFAYDTLNRVCSKTVASDSGGLRRNLCQSDGTVWL